MGDTFTYYVTVIDPCPPPSELAPYGPDGRCSDRSTPTPVPTPTPVRYVPSKAEYLHSFALSGPLPYVVRSQRRWVETRIDRIRIIHESARQPFNRRLANAIAWYDDSDLACSYDPSRLARIWHYHVQHARRWNGRRMHARFARAAALGA